MEQIIAELTEMLKSSGNVIEASEKMRAYWAQLQCEVTARALENMDDFLWKEYKKEGARSLRKDRRTLITLAGEVTICRRLVRTTDDTLAYPLDEAMGFGKRERFSPYMQYLIADLATKCTYRTTAHAVTMLAGVRVSHTQVGTIVRRIGEKYSSMEDNAFAQEVSPDAKLEKVDLLRIEGDGVLIKGKGGTHHEIHRFQAAEGIRETRGRRALFGVRRVAAIDHSKAVRKMQGYLEHKFDLSETLVLSNSDGGAGYGKETFDTILGVTKRHEHFRDRYHANRKCKERLSFVPKPMVDTLCRALSLHNKEGVDALLDTAEALAQNEKQIESVERLRQYIGRNWDFLAPTGKRGLEDLGGGLGTCESNHRLFTYRMKHRGMYWSKEGAEGMVRVITGLSNGDLKEALSKQNPRFAQEHDKKYKNAVRNALKKCKNSMPQGILRGSIPLNCSTSSAMGKLSQTIRDGGFGI